MIRSHIEFFATMHLAIHQNPPPLRGAGASTPDIHHQIPILCSLELRKLISFALTTSRTAPEGVSNFGDSLEDAHTLRHRGKAKNGDLTFSNKERQRVALVPTSPAKSGNYSRLLRRRWLDSREVSGTVDMDWGQGG